MSHAKGATAATEQKIATGGAEDTEGNSDSGPPFCALCGKNNFTGS